MEARGAALKRAAGIACLLLAACAPSAGTVPDVGDAAPARWADDGTGRPLVAWIVRGEDYLGCLTSAAELRALQRRYGDRFRLTLLYVGENPGWAAGIARRERLAARIEHLDAAAFRAEFGRTKLPAFFVVHRGAVTARAMSPDGTRPPAVTGGAVENAVRSALARGRAGSWSGTGVQPGRTGEHP